VFSLRQAAAADADFVYRVVEATMRHYVKQTWGSFSEELGRKGMGELVAPDHIELAQLFILPSHQNRGIGTSILRSIMQEARQAGKPVRLRLLAVNPARRLYEREGFRVSSTTPERIYMELPV